MDEFPSLSQSSAPSQSNSLNFGALFQEKKLSKNDFPSLKNDKTSPIAQITQQDKWGLLGLLDFIKGDKGQDNVLALGNDLTGMGLDLTSDGTLSTQFASPFADPPTSKIADPPTQFTIPSCYTLPQPPPPALSKITAFSDETLLYMFYALPASALSEAAANELYARAWRFHKELQCWITKEPDMIPTRTQTYEKGIFWVFDNVKWERERREMTVRYDDLEDRGPVVMPQMQGAPTGPGNVNAAIAALLGGQRPTAQQLALIQQLQATGGGQAQWGAVGK